MSPKETDSNDLPASPLLLDGWQEFNRIKWGVEVNRVRYKTSEADLPSLDVCFYHDKRGRIVVPPRNPYSGLVFTPIPNGSVYRLNKQWSGVAEQLLDEMRSRGLANSFVLPPEITDVRLWQWAGFRVGIKYTYYIDFPYDLSQAASLVRQRINKASKRGYRCERTYNFADVTECLAETEARKGFEHQLTVRDLELARDLIGDEYFRAYVSYSPDGEPACAQVWLHIPGCRAVAWIGGGKTTHLSSGVNQLTTNYIVEDLQEGGATGFDYCGANLQSVATAKAKFGCRLVPYYHIEPNGVKQLASLVLGWLKSWWSERRG